MDCTICGKPIVLSPSAAERARKDVCGHSAKYYTGLFRQHSDCLIQKRNNEVLELIRRGSGGQHGELR